MLRVVCFLSFFFFLVFLFSFVLEVIEYLALGGNERRFWNFRRSFFEREKKKRNFSFSIWDGWFVICSFSARFVFFYPFCWFVSVCLFVCLFIYLFIFFVFFQCLKMFRGCFRVQWEVFILAEKVEKWFFVKLI